MGFIFRTRHSRPSGLLTLLSWTAPVYTPNVSPVYTILRSSSHHKLTVFRVCVPLQCSQMSVVRTTGNLSTYLTTLGCMKARNANYVVSRNSCTCGVRTVGTSTSSGKLKNVRIRISADPHHYKYPKSRLFIRIDTLTIRFSQHQMLRIETRVTSVQVVPDFPAFLTIPNPPGWDSLPLSYSTIRGSSGAHPDLL